MTGGGVPSADWDGWRGRNGDSTCETSLGDVEMQIKRHKSFMTRDLK